MSSVLTGVGTLISASVEDARAAGTGQTLSLLAYARFQVAAGGDVPRLINAHSPLVYTRAGASELKHDAVPVQIALICRRLAAGKELARRQITDGHLL